MNKNTLLLYKRLGETPLEAITRYKQVSHTTTDKLSFAGRLDPMAEGLLLVLKNEENKKRKEYEALSKTYECSFIVGFSTDTYDLLGKITNVADILPNLVEQQRRIEQIIPNLVGKRAQQYPPFSSYHLNGKPLYYWELRNQLDHTTLPIKHVNLYSVEIVGFEILKKTYFMEELTKRLALVQGNFRQADIKQLWDKKLSHTNEIEFLLTKLRITCSSGTYIRGLVHEIGRLLGIPCVTFSIIRTKIGEYSLTDIEEII